MFNQLTREQVLALRDVFIFKTSKLTSVEVRLMMNSLTKELNYAERKKLKGVSRRRKLFAKNNLERKVWRDFIDEERSKGKNSLMIAIELGESLSVVNSYF